MPIPNKTMAIITCKTVVSPCITSSNINKAILSIARIINKTTNTVSFFMQLPLYQTLHQPFSTPSALSHMVDKNPPTLHVKNPWIAPKIIPHTQLANCVECHSLRYFLTYALINPICIFTHCSPAKQTKIAETLNTLVL